MRLDEIMAEITKAKEAQESFESRAAVWFDNDAGKHSEELILLIERLYEKKIALCDYMKANSISLTSILI